MKKGFIARQALRKIGIRSDEFEADNDEIGDALIELESMVLNLDGRGIRIGYELAPDPELIDPNVDAGIPDIYSDALIYQLAVRLAPDYGKAVSPTLATQAAGSLNTLYMAIDTPSIQYERNMPVGSGNNHRFQHHFNYYRPSSDITVENAYVLGSNNGQPFNTGSVTLQGGGGGVAPGPDPGPDPGGDIPAPTAFTLEVLGSGAGTNIILNWRWDDDTVVPSDFIVVRNGEDVREVEFEEGESEYSYTDDGPGAGTFNYTVLAVVGGERGTPTGTESATVLPFPLGTVSLDGDGFGDQAELSWEWMPDPADVIDGFRMRRNGVVVTNFDESDPNLRDFNDIPGEGSFTYRVSAINAGGESAFSNPITVTLTT